MENSKSFLRRTIVYIRSFKKGKNNCLSVDEQKERIVSYAEDRGYNIVEIFSDSNKTGRNMKREGLQNMLSFIQRNYRNVNFLIVPSVNKLSTNKKDFKKIKSFLKHYRVRLVSLVYIIDKYTRK